MSDSGLAASALKIGLVVNPMAGIGGAVGLQGSDGSALQREALKRHGVPRGPERLTVFFRALAQRLPAQSSAITWLTWGGAMGADALNAAGLSAQVFGTPDPHSTATDTRQAIEILCASGIDLLVFVGGDGTARDVLASVSEQTCVLGLPAGVKMHSGVFAISPVAAAEIVVGLVQGQLIGRMARDVRDYVPNTRSPAMDSRAAVVTKRYGELWVPEAVGYLQQMKVGGKEDEGLVLQEIASYFVDHPDRYQDKALVLGPGSTNMAIKQALGLNGTLLGCDVLMPNGRTLENATQEQLLTLSADYPLHVVISFTRHQGFLLGRGNQQLSPEVMQGLNWKQDVTVLGSRSKLDTLAQRPMLVDTGDASLDATLSGLVSVLAGYDDYLLYRVSNTLLPDASLPDTPLPDPS